LTQRYRRKSIEVEAERDAIERAIAVTCAFCAAGAIAFVEGDGQARHFLAGDGCWIACHASAIRALLPGDSEKDEEK
jgi:hypothetical protein